jgi:hypothetical protein
LSNSASVGSSFIRPLGCARQTDLGETGSDWRLPGDECGAAGCAALLPVPVSKDRAFFGEAVNVRRLVAHHAHVVGADIELADVVSPDDEDVGLLGLRICKLSGGKESHDRAAKSECVQLDFCFHVSR